MQSRRSSTAAQESVATKSRSFRSFLLMEQFAAREIGERIAQARKERGLTQEELAEMAPFSKRSLQDYEGGMTIPYRHLRDLSRLLKRPEEWFLYGEDAASATTEERLGHIEQRLAEILDRLDRAAEDRADPAAG